MYFRQKQHGLTSGAGRTVGAHHLLRLGDDGAAGAPRARAGLAVGGGARGGIAVVPVATLLAVGAGRVVSAVTDACVERGCEETGRCASR